jgi:hypothetical protein
MTMSSSFMNRRTSSIPLIIGLACIGIFSLLLDFSGLLKTQVLQTPETLSTVKLVLQRTDPIRFDIYYEQLKTSNPPDISIVFVNSLIESAGRYTNFHQIVDQVLLQTGTQELLSTPSIQTLTIKNIQQQGTTKLGSITTNISKDEYISLEYDTVVNRTRVTQIDQPVPVDFPLDYKTVINPTNELVYIASPGFHTILSADDKALVKNEILHGALLLPNQMTTLQQLEGLSQANLIRQDLQRTTPELIIEQNQIVLPKIPANDLNTLILRYRSGSNPWNYNSFLLSSTKDITLKVPLEHLLDFFTEVEYSFAYISNGWNTINNEFPYNSLLPNEQHPVYSRTDFESLLPELYQLKNSLKLNLTVSIAPQENAVSFGILTREPLFNLSDVLQKVEQRLPVMIFEDDSAQFETRVSQSSQLPYFNLFGKNNQIWSQRINRDNISLVSQQFRQIPLLSSDQVPELEVVNQSTGDRLLCFVKTETGSYSLATVSTDFMLTSSCLQSARRAGITKGRMYPVKYDVSSHQLVALRHYDFDETLSSQVPVIRNYNPATKTVTLTTTFPRENIRLLVSPSADFSSSATQSVTLTENQFTLPVLAGCQTSCYFKVVSMIREDQNSMLGYASETLLFAETALPALHLCFTNLPLVSELFEAEELNLQIIRSNGQTVPMIFRETSGCYEYSAEEAEEILDASGNPVIETNLDGYFSNSEIVPKKTIVIHSNGLQSNHINIPPQRHYISAKTDSLQQVLTTQLVFEHFHLSAIDHQIRDSVLQKSYNINLWGNQAVLTPINKGNIVVHTTGRDAFFLERIPLTPPLNETVLYPGGTHVLAIPNTIRFLTDDEIVIQGFRETDKSIILPLPIPERSTIRMFLENVFRPNIQVKQLISDGILYNQETGFISLENPTGIISLPILVNITKPTDVASYARTFPPTPVPGNIDLATFQTQLVFEVVEPSDIPTTSVLSPIDLERAQSGETYSQQLPLGGIEDSSSFEIGDSRFLTTECQNIFTFDPEKRLITGQVPLESVLQGCYFQVNVRYLVKIPSAQIEVTTLRSYRIPMLENPNAAGIEPEVIQVPIRIDEQSVSQVVNLLEPIEEVIETTSEFAPKSNSAQLITSIGELSILFSPEQQRFIFSGNPSALTSEVSRYIQAVRSETGELVLIEFQLIPVQHQEIVIPIVEGFPNQIILPVILAEQGFTEEEVTASTLVTDSLSAPIELENNVVTIFGLPELQDQVFSVILEKTVKTPSSLVEFDSRLSDQSSDTAPNKIRVDFKLTVLEAETITLQALEFDVGKSLSIDLRSYIPGNHILNSTQIPSFLQPRGFILSGTTPDEGQELELLIQDFTDVKNYIIPLRILGPEPVPVTPEPIPSTDDLKPSAGDETCFPDISNQPLEYREAICLAEEYGIISGTNGLFHPDDPINRAEISKILVTGPLIIFGFLTASDIPSLPAAFITPRFPDVGRTAWFYGFVETVKEVEIFSGYPDGSFKPANYLIQAEASKIIVGTLLQLHPQSFPSNILQANTVAGDQWFSPYVRILNQNGGDLPDPGEISELSRPITRAQFIYNLLILLDSKAEGLASTL